MSNHKLDHCSDARSAWWSKHFEVFRQFELRVNALWLTCCGARLISPCLKPVFVQTQEEQAEIMKYGNPREKGKLQYPSRPNRKKGQELWRSDRKGSTDRELLSTTSETVFLFLFYIQTTGISNWSTWLNWRVPIDCFQVTLCQFTQTLLLLCFQNNLPWVLQQVIQFPV